MRTTWVPVLLAVLLLVPAQRVEADEGAPVAVGPRIFGFGVNEGAAATTSRTVTLNSVCSGSPTQYRVSENVDFLRALWQPYSTSATYHFTHGTGARTRTLYFQVKDVLGNTSDIASDSINVDALFSFSIDADAATTSDFTVQLNHTCTDGATAYRVSEKPSFSDATWLPYNALPEYTFFSPAANATLYFQTRSASGDSDVMQDSVAVEPNPATGAVQAFVEPEGPETSRAYWTVDSSGAGYAGGDLVDPVAAGLHRLEFFLLQAYPPYPPEDRIVFVRPGETVSATGQYTANGSPGTLQARPASPVVTPDDLVTIPLSLTSNRSGATGMNGTFTWNPTQLTLVSVQRGPSVAYSLGASPSVTFGLNALTGVLNYVWMQQPPNNELPDGEFIWVTFKVADTCPVPCVIPLGGTLTAIRYVGGDLIDTVDSAFVAGSVDVDFNQPPTITTLNASTRSGQAPLAVSFETAATDREGTQVSYSWDFNDDGQPDSTEQNPAYTFPEGTAPGTVTVTLTATDEDGLNSTATLPLTITEHAPVAEEVATPEEGGSVTTPDGISIDVPAGAVSEETVITASPVGGPSYSVEGTTIFFRLELGPANALFSAPIHITVPVPADLKDAKGLTIRYYNEATGEWSSDGITNVQIVATPEGTTLQFDTTHFSEYAIVGTLGPDINLDTFVNARDVQLVINAALGKNIGLLNANVNGLGKVDAADVQRVINAALGRF